MRNRTSCAHVSLRMGVAPLLLLGVGCGASGGHHVDVAALAPTVAYIGDTSGTFELFVADVDGGGFANVSGPMVAGGNVTDFKWSPDGTMLAFRADKEVDERFDLYVVSRSGGTVHKVSPLPATADIVIGNGTSRFSWAPDSSRIAYLADQETQSFPELFTSLPDGTGNVKVSGTMVAGGSVSPQAVNYPGDRTYYGFSWAPNSSRIAYVANQESSGTSELFTSLPAGGGNVKVSGALGLFGQVATLYFSWAPDSSRISYIAYQGAPAAYELFTTLPAAAASTKVSGTLVAGGNVTYGPVQWSPDSSRIAYSADQSTDAIVELYTSPPATAVGNVKVSGALVAGGAVDGYFFRWAPDSSRIAYVADQDTDQQFELYTSPAATAVGNAKVSGTLIPAGDVLAGSIRWAPDSSRIAYLADQDTDDQLEIFTSSPATSAGNVKISGPMAVGGGAVNSFALDPLVLWAPDSSQLAYIADQVTNDVQELFTSFPATEVGNDRVSGTLIAGRSVLNLRWTGDGTRLVYESDEGSDGVFQLFSVNPDGTGEVQVSGRVQDTNFARFDVK